ncbi:MAG TPA: hypothetical protein VLC72_01750 [Nitrosopumilaceae archaeon]|nr:hypothetical protein [Nitrosopumilaceae archaeon]
MINQYIWFGIAIATFLGGLGLGYAVILNNSQPVGMMTQTQLMQQMMMQSPEHRRQMMEALSENPKDMRQWMANTQHIEEMSQIMKEDHDFMTQMMAEIINDPELRLQMIGHMTENPEAMKMMQQMMGQGMMQNQTMGHMMNP